jgi:hypothetical protein
LFARLFFASEETTFVFVLFPVFLVISALFLARARDPPSNPKVSFWVVFFPLGVSLGKMRHVMMERPRRRALPRAAKKLDHTRREENASGCRVVVNDAGEDDDIIKVLSCTRLSLSLVFL